MIRDVGRSINISSNWQAQSAPPPRLIYGKLICQNLEEGRLPPGPLGSVIIISWWEAKPQDEHFFFVLLVSSFLGLFNVLVMLYILAIDASNSAVFLHLVQCTELLHWLLLQADASARSWRVILILEFLVWWQCGSSLEEWYLNINKVRDGSNIHVYSVYWTNGSNLRLMTLLFFIQLLYNCTLPEL